jgi:hypothetical protein
VAGSLEIQQVRERLRYDTPFWAAHCATILNVNKRPVRLTRGRGRRGRRRRRRM